jgi:hypothetical protein
MAAGVDWHYLAPECFNRESDWSSDVFAFALILFELVVGQPAIPKHLQGRHIERLLAVENFPPEIPEWVESGVQELIMDCWENDANDRPTFEAIFDRLEEMDFKVVAGVNSAKLRRFVDDIDA